jgi:energy-coupling factor transport system substrate-specific component
LKDLVKMWSNTLMVVLSAVSAALYVALLLPFKFLLVIPGFAELRPAGAIPPSCGLFFGPAGAFGAGFGNLIGDIFGGMLGPVSLFGVVANFLYGYLPYKAYRALAQENFALKMPLRNWLALLFSVALGACSCGIVIGFGADLFGFVPFKALANWICFNNLLFGLTLCPLIVISIFAYIKDAGLFYEDLIAPKKAGAMSFVGIILVLLGILVALGLGNFPGPIQNLLDVSGKMLTAATVGPGVALIILGAVLI